LTAETSEVLHCEHGLYGSSTLGTGATGDGLAPTGAADRVGAGCSPKR
jgi:hypothetical protein